MKNNRLMLIILLFCIIFTAVPVVNAFGLGIIIGSPTGLSFKTAAIAPFAIDGALAWNLFNPSFTIHIDADFSLLSLGSSAVLYAGLGGRLGLGNDYISLAGRIPFGIDWLVIPRIDIFFEDVPVVEIIPATGFGVDLGIGARFYI